VRLAPCGGDGEGKFLFPSSGHGSIRTEGASELCLAPAGEAADGSALELRSCAASHGALAQHFLLPRAPPSSDGRGAFLGVNLGGWLIMEDWMWPAELEASQLHDEHSYIAEHGGPGDRRAQERMHQHWDSFLRPEHLDRLRRFGVTHVRIPFGYWLLDRVYNESDGFVSGGEAYLKRALGWLKARGMLAVLDLHASPGGQARMQSFTGRITEEEHFFLDDAKFAQGKLAVEAMVELVLKYEADSATSGVVVGVELMNEPSHRHIVRTKEFYSEMVPLVRRSLPAEKYLVLLSFMGSPHTSSMDWLAEKISAKPEIWSGVVHDSHLYHLFGDNQAPWTKEQDYCKTCCRDMHILRPKKAAVVPTIVGEYSVATGFTGWHEDGFLEKNLHNFLSLWSTTGSVVGSFFWNFRILTDPSQPMKYLEWSLLGMIDHGYLAPDFAHVADTSAICPGMGADVLERCPDFSNSTVEWDTRCELQAAAAGSAGVLRLLAPAAPIFV